MLESLFKGILNISLYATVVAVTVMFIKLICGKRLSPNFHYGIWFLFLFKLVFPFELKSVLSIFTLFNHIAPEPVTEQINTVLPPITTGLFVQSPNLTAEMPVVAKGLDLWNVAAILWLTGIIIMLAALVFSYIKTSKIIKTTSEKPGSRLLDILSICQAELNSRCNTPVYTTRSFSIPFIFGFIKPIIILPVHIYIKLPDEGIKAILLHELMHIKRKDYLVNLILFLLKSVYWFNPIVWLAFAWMKNDAERACDSAVVKEYSTEKRGKYAKALLDVAVSVGKHTYIPAVSAFTEGNFKERIRNVLKGRRYSFRSASIAVIVFIAAGVILLTGAQAKSEKADYSTEAETEPSGAIIIDEPRIVIPNVLEVNKTISDYAHAQHLIWVEGRFKHAEGELYLALLDENGKPLARSGLQQAEEVSRMDEEWSFFRHKLIEETWKILDIDKAIILFELKKDSKSIKGQLTVPARKPVGIIPTPSETQGKDSKSNNSFVITDDGDFPNSPDVTALVPTDQADQKELEVLLPEIIPRLYTEPGYEKYEGVHLEMAADAGIFGEMVKNWAGPEVAKSTWVVGLRFPAFDPSNSAGAGKFFVTKTRDGWEIWQRYH